MPPSLGEDCSGICLKDNLDPRRGNGPPGLSRGSITSDDGEAEDSFAKKLKDMVSKINADAERIGVVMTYEEDLQHRLWHRDREWQDKLDEKDALLEQRALQISDQAQRIEKQDAIIEDLRKQIEVLKTNAPA